MLFEWDEAKRQSNVLKHGIDFRDALNVFDDRPRLVVGSPRRGEVRSLSVAVLDGRLTTVVWAWRGDDVIRIISVRRRDVRKRGNIVRYTVDEIEAMLVRGESQTDWARVDAKTEEELAADTASDPAWDGIPEDWYLRAHAASGLLVRGKENKRQVTMRFDADILDHFKSQGRGWQSRMNAVLRGFVDQVRQTEDARRPNRRRG